MIIVLCDGIKLCLGPKEKSRIRINVYLDPGDEPHVKKQPTHVDAEAVELMMRYHWPENVREVERLVIAVDPGV